MRIVWPEDILTKGVGIVVRQVVGVGGAALHTDSCRVGEVDESLGCEYWGIRELRL